MVAQTRESVALLVQERLRKDPVAGKKVRVLADQVRLGDGETDWWWVPVALQEDPFKVYYYYELFSNVEEDLQTLEHINVLLVPRIIESPASI